MALGVQQRGLYTAHASAAGNLATTHHYMPNPPGLTSCLEGLAQGCIVARLPAPCNECGMVDRSPAQWLPCPHDVKDHCGADPLVPCQTRAC